MIIASRPVISVWNSSAAIPNWTGLSSGSHCWNVKKLAVLARSAGTDRKIRNAAMAAMISSTVAPAATLSDRKTRSPRRTAAPLISPETGAPPPIDGVVAVPSVGPSLISRSSIGPDLVPRSAQLASLPARAAGPRARSWPLLPAVAGSSRRCAPPPREATRRTGRWLADDQVALSESTAERTLVARSDGSGE